MLPLHQSVLGLLLIYSHMEQQVVSSIRRPPTVTFSAPTGTGNGLEGTATIDDFGLYGGTVKSLAITTEGKFYTSAPTVTMAHPGTSVVSATIGIAGSSIDSGSVAFTTTGRAYTTAPTVAITTSGSMIPPTVETVGIATIHPITGIVTAISFNPSDPWKLSEPQRDHWCWLYCCTYYQFLWQSLTSSSCLTTEYPL